MGALVGIINITMLAFLLMAPIVTIALFMDKNIE